MKRRKLQGNSGVTMRQSFEQFQDYNTVRNLAEDTCKFYQHNVGYFINFVGGPDVLISSITESKVHDYIVEMKRSDSISDVTVNVRLRALRPYLYYCMKNNLLERFEVNMIKALYPLKEPYTDAELTVLLKKPDLAVCAFSEYRDWVIENFLLSTGCRLGTLVEIKVGDLDLTERVVYFRHMKARNQSVVPLSSSMVGIFREYLRYREGEGDDYLFVSETNKQMTPNTVHSSIARYNKRRGINKTSVHLFRHTFAMKYIQAGGDPFRLQKLLGHSDLTMTRHYVSLYADDLKANYDRLNPLEQFRIKDGQNEKNSKKGDRASL